MSKNKNKANNAKVNTTEKVEKSQPKVVKPIEQEVKKPEKTVTPPPVEKPVEDPTVETKAVEIIATSTEITTLPDINNIRLKPEQRISGDGLARLLDVAQRHISNMKPNEPSTIKMEQIFTYNLAWGLTKATIQAREEKIEYGLKVPNDDVIVQDVIDTFNNLGVALSPHKELGEDGQLTLTFDKISPETEKQAKEEIKQQKTPVIPELDPLKWKDEKDARNGLSWVLSQQNITFPNRFNETLMKTRLYRQNQAAEKDKSTWDKIGLGALFEDAVSLLGNKSTALVRGLCQGTVGSFITDHNMIFGHATVKYNLPSLSEEDIVDLIKSFIKVRNDSKTPVDECTAVKYGILEPTRDVYLNIPIDAENSQSENSGLAKKIMNKFYEAYKMEIPKNDPHFMLNATNKMITIRNMYVDKAAAFALYTEDEYPKSSSKTKETADPKKTEEKKESK